MTKDMKKAALLFILAVISVIILAVLPYEYEVARCIIAIFGIIMSLLVLYLLTIKNI